MNREINRDWKPTLQDIEMMQKGAVVRVVVESNSVFINVIDPTPTDTDHVYLLLLGKQWRENRFREHETWLKTDFFKELEKQIGWLKQ